MRNIGNYDKNRMKNETKFRMTKINHDIYLLKNFFE